MDISNLRPIRLREPRGTRDDIAILLNCYISKKKKYREYFSATGIRKILYLK